MKMLSQTLTRKQQVIYGVVGTLGILVMWELFMRSGIFAKPGLPVPTQVFTQAGRLLQDANFWEQVLYTMGVWLLGLAIAAIAGVILGSLMGAFSKMFIAFELPVEVFRTLPSIAVGPILVLLLGSGALPIAITVALSSVWPILLNTMYGVRSTDTTAVATAKTFGIKPFGLLMHIKLISALPFSFTGIRIAASIGLIVTVSAELLIGSGQGIGGFILIASANAVNLDGVYAATLIAGVLGVVVNMAFAAIDNSVFAWKKGLSQ